MNVALWIVEPRRTLAALRLIGLIDHRQTCIPDGGPITFATTTPCLADDH
jgi:hypothetical protein